MNKKLLKSAFIDDADVMKAIENREQKDMLAKILETKKDSFLEALKPLFKGDSGYTPVKGKDYFTPQEISDFKAEILKGATPEKFKDYFTEKELVYLMSELRKVFQHDLESMKAQITPKKGVDYDDGVSPDEVSIASRVIDMLPKTKELDLKPIFDNIKEIESKVPTMESIVKELKSKKLLVETRKVNGMDVNMNDMRWHGGGLSTVAHDGTLTGNGTPSSPLSVVGGGGGYTVLAVTGTINDTNVTFTVASLPQELVINGMSYIPAGGAITWSYLAGTLTLSSPVGSGGSIYARS
jgi:hypothetical protein